MDFNKCDLNFTEIVTGFNIRRNLTIGMRHDVGLCEDLIWFTELQNKEFETDKQLLKIYYMWIKSLSLQIKAIIKEAREEVDIKLKNQKLQQIGELTSILEDLVAKYG